MADPEQSKLSMSWKKLLSSMTLLGVLSTTSNSCAEDQVKPSSNFDQQNLELVSDLRAKGINSDAVLEALAKTPRHVFVPDAIKDMSYEDNALPIGLKQTISQPYVVAFMTEALALSSSDKVLEVGTGSGYQAAVLSHLVQKVFSVELLDPLAKRARLTLDQIGVKNVEIKTGDGYKGWLEHAPFDAIIVTASPLKIPQNLVDQLKDGGRMIIPVGERDIQWLVLITKNKGEVTEKKLIPVRFVPMVHGDSKN